MVKYQPFERADSEMDTDHYGPAFDTLEKAIEWVLEKVEKCEERKRQGQKVDVDCGHGLDILVVDVPKLLKVGVSEPYKKD